jgi:membrane-bound lytic murein transglycosylase A
MTAVQRRDGIAALLFGGLTLSLLTALNIAPAEARNPMKIPDAQYEPTTWSMVDGWAEDDHDDAFAAFLNSCKAILSGMPSSRPGRPMHAGLYKVCQRAVDIKPQKPGEAREFFEKNFQPVRISPLGTPDGFLTGYYEPIVAGKRSRADGYDQPLYRKPSELLPGGRMAIMAAATTGKKKARKRKLVAYHDRAAIDDGILAGRNLEICWLKDPIDSFFAQIQGSVRVALDDGKLLRLNYQAANGQPYYAVGRWLIDQKIIPKDEMSMDRIREWMQRNPEQAKELRRKNKSYVFFRETDLASNEEPIGAQGVSLTPGRSIAVDHKLHVYGTPFFISAYLPMESLKPDTWFRRLMIAQDTGGAIVGPARADIYFGAGDEAESVAGRLRHYGKFVMLVPRTIEPEEKPEEIPLPRPRPKNLARSVATAASEPVPQIAATAKPAGKAERKADKTVEAKAARDGAPEKQVEAKREQAEKKAGRKVAAKPADRAAEKKVEAKHEKKKREKVAGKATATKTDMWESRVMPKLSPQTPAKKPKSKNKG